MDYGLNTPFQRKKMAVPKGALKRTTSQDLGPDRPSPRKHVTFNLDFDTQMGNVSPSTNAAPHAAFSARPNNTPYLAVSTMFGAGAKPSLGLTISTSAANAAPPSQSAAGSLFAGLGSTSKTAEPASSQGAGLLFGGSAASKSQGTGLFGAAASQPASQPAAGGFGTTTTQTAAGGLFGAAPSQPAAGGLFGASSAQPAANTLLGVPSSQPTGTGLFGTVPTQNTQAGGAFGAAPSQNTQAGSLFGAAPTQNTQAGGLFGAAPAPAQPAAGGLLGAAASQPAAAGGLFGTAPQPAAGGGLFGAKPQPTGNGGLFGAPTAQPAAMSLFGASANKPATGLFGSSTAQAANPNTLSLGQGNIGKPGGPPFAGQGPNTVKIDLEHLRPTTKFDQLTEELQKEILALDTMILNEMTRCDEVTTLLPSISGAGANIPNDVAFVAQKLQEVEIGLENDAGDIEKLKEDVVKQDAGEAKICFRELDRLKMPQQYQSSIAGPAHSLQSSVYAGHGLAGWWNQPQTLQRSTRGDLGATGTRAFQLPGEEDESLSSPPASLLALFNRKADDMKASLTEKEAILAEIETFVGSVEDKIAAKQMQLAGQRSDPHGEGDQVGLLKYVFGEFERSLFDLAAKVSSARDGVQELVLTTGERRAERLGR